MPREPEIGTARRRFLVGVTGVGASVGLGFGLGTLARSAKSAEPPTRSAGPMDPRARDEAATTPWIEAEDTPLEDLMREHAVLDRVLLVYEEGARRLDAGAEVSPETLAKAGGIVRRYIEDHHERDEENHIFPRLERIGAELALVATLRLQHDAGRRLTSDVIRLATATTLRDAGERARLADSMRAFIRMYRSHAAYENTVLFPAFRKSVSRDEYARLGVMLEGAERAAFGTDLYARIMDEVRGLERSFGIGELAAFTPR